MTFVDFLGISDSVTMQYDFFSSIPDERKEQIEDASERAKALVQQIFVFSRKNDAVREPVKVADIVSNARSKVDKQGKKAIVCLSYKQHLCLR